MSIEQICKGARNASFELASLTATEKNKLLLAIRDGLKAGRERIAEANKKDLALAQKMVDQGEINQSLMNRLYLQDEKIDLLFSYLEEVAKLEDPVGKKQFAMQLDEGLELERVTCPLGVVAIIFESRPEVVIQVSALSLKSSNAVILKGGKEAAHSNRILFEIINETLEKFGLKGAVNLIETREDVTALLDQDAYVDLIIPRGGNEFVRYIQENTRIPVLGHSSGICHLYLDAEAEKEMAIKLSIDSKLNYPSACNAVETILVHQDIAASVLPELFTALQAQGVKVIADEGSMQYGKNLQAATVEDWDTEYSDLAVSIKLVQNMQEAIAHINLHGSHHTDSIITTNEATATEFMNRVDSGCCFHNASTRFSDGFVFGLGAEVGISTNKTHSRGPVGLDGMVIYKYKLKGHGQIKGDYSGANAKPFTHKPMPLD